MTDLQRITGFSRDQLRDRLGLLGATIADDLQRGPRNKVIVGDKTLAALKRMVELERGGLAPQVAAAQVIREMSNPDGNGDPTLAPSLRMLLAEKERLIEELRRDKLYLQEQLARTLGQLEEFQQRALPPVRSHRWWPWTRTRRGSKER
jgi:hypothetical protein